MGFDGTHYALEFLVNASGPKRDYSLARAATALPDMPTVASFTVTRTSRG